MDWRSLDHETAEKIRQDYLHVERSKQQLQKDLTIAFDQIHDLKCAKRNLKNKIWVLGGALTALAAVTGWLANHLFDCLALIR